MLVVQLLPQSQLIPHDDDSLSQLQDRQCMYNVTLRRFRLTVVTAEKQ